MNEQLNQLLNLIQGLWRYRWSALAIAWLVFLGGAFVVYILPDQYEARAVVYVDTESIMKPLLKGLAVDTEESDAMQVITRMLLNRENLLAVLRETDMDLKSRTTRERDEMLDKLRQAIVVTGGNTKNNRRGDPDAGLYEISYDGDAPERVYQVVSKLLNIFIEKALNATRIDTSMAQKFLDEQIRQYEVRLTMAEKRLADFKRKNAGLMPGEQGGYYKRVEDAKTRIDELHTQLTLAQRRREELRKQLKGERPLIGTGEYTGLSARAQQLRQYRNQLEELLARFTEQHPEVVALKAKIAQLEAGTDDGVPATGGNKDQSIELNPMYQQLKADLSQAEVDVATLKVRLAAEERRLAGLQKAADRLPEIEAELARLNRDYNVTQDRYSELVGRREAARLSQEAEQNSSDIKLRVIDPPVIPSKPVGPNRLLLLTGVLFAALGAGAGWAFLLLQLHPTFREPKALRRATGLPVLGAVSLRIGPATRLRMKMQTTAFAGVVLVLLGVWGGSLYYSNEGSERLRGVITLERIQQLMEDLRDEHI